MQKRIHVIFTGRVQGVGFRYTTEDIAQSFGVTGWVKNLRSGEVEIIAEGEEEILTKFIGRLKEEFSGCVSDCKLTWDEYQDEFRGFEIRF